MDNTKLINANIDEKLFNHETKEEYFKHILESGQVSEESLKGYIRFMQRLYHHEKELNKDLMHFTFEEMENVLISFDTRFRGTVESYARIISTYLNWASGEGYINNNVLQKLKPQDFNKYVKEQDIFITDKQLMRYEDLLENYQDAVIFRLLFEGVCGRQMSELRNLKYNNEFINEETNTLKLINSLEEDDKGKPIKYSERYIKVSDRTMNLIKKAYEENTYSKSNGEVNDDTGRIRDYTDLIRNDYVLRPSNTKTNTVDSPLDKHVIYYRIKSASKFLGIDRLTSKFLLRSGMINYAKNIVDLNEGVKLSDIKIIASRFDVKSFHNLKGFITDENVRNA